MNPGFLILQISIRRIFQNTSLFQVQGNVKSFDVKDTMKELSAGEEVRGRQVSVTGIGQDDYNVLSCILRALCQLYSSPQSSAGGNTYQNTFA